LEWYLELPLTRRLHRAVLTPHDIKPPPGTSFTDRVATAFNGMHTKSLSRLSVIRWHAAKHWVRPSVLINLRPSWAGILGPRFVTGWMRVVRSAWRRRDRLTDDGTRRAYSPSVVVIGAFCPPVNGMAVAMDTFVDLLSGLGQIRRIRTVPARHMPRSLHHMCRIRLTISALRGLARTHAGVSVVLSVDAGYGMAYTIALALAARGRGHSLMLQHHSSAYVTRRSLLMRVLVAASGPSATHLFLCQSTCQEFARLYPRVGVTRVVSVAYAASLPASAADARTAIRGLTLGHMSNLTLQKGLAEAVALVSTAGACGVVDRLILAGPIMGPRERQVVDGTQSTGDIQYRGPVSGLTKDEFFNDIDVFLLPSRYRNELSPLVIWEAMLRGIPVIAYKVGCLGTPPLQGLTVIPLSDDFVESALGQLRAWRKDPSLFATASANALREANAARQTAVLDVMSLGSRLFREAAG
jgi:glycosyltransferase involved in cell wall biosynthesis